MFTEERYEVLPNYPEKFRNAEYCKPELEVMEKEVMLWLRLMKEDKK